MEILLSITVLVSIGLFAGIVLIIAYSKLKVKEDARTEEILAELPGINCGACGFASCSSYAVAVAGAGASVNLCKVGGAKLSEKLSLIMDVNPSASSAELKAVVHCGVKTRQYSAEYSGPTNCASAHLLGAGMKCKYGCIGLGDCVSACPFGAITMNENGIPEIDLNLCTGCSLCVNQCPRNIIGLRELSGNRIVYVACSNLQSGKETRTQCPDGCIACKICEKKGPEGSFAVENNLSYLKAQTPELIVADIKCPTKCILENMSSAPSEQGG